MGSVFSGHLALDGINDRGAEHFRTVADGHQRSFGAPLPVMGTEDVLRGSKPASTRKSSPRKRRAVAAKEPEIPDRSSVYRGMSPEEARAAYHADAQAMIRMGYAPDSEQWATVLEHVLTVRYVYAPARRAAVLAALEEIGREPANAAPEPAAARPSMLRRTIDLGQRLPLELKLPVGGIAGLLVGVALCLLVGLISGDRPDTITLFGFGVIGMVLGTALSLIPD